METLDFSDVFITKVSFIALPGGRSPLNLNPSVWMSQNRIARLQNVAFKNFNHRLAREARESRTANLSHLPPVRTSETHCVRFLATVPPSSVLSRSNIILSSVPTKPSRRLGLTRLGSTFKVFSSRAGPFFWSSRCEPGKSSSSRQDIGSDPSRASRDLQLAAKTSPA